MTSLNTSVAGAPVSITSVPRARPSVVSNRGRGPDRVGRGPDARAPAGARAPLETAVRELDRRSNDGIDARLLWNSQTNRVWVAVEDERSGVALRFGVGAVDALEAFHPPCA